ncbi:MAG: AAA family ATPase, partial [Marinicaulis sp.]|nr:AAA family ATPase [Marinicaulis sp.]
MRITRFDLARYGHFTDFPIDFGDDPSGPNFHIIFGENEAGKSTIRDAFLDFLYGIPMRTPYNFLHDNNVLEIGATVQIGTEEHRLIRRKRNVNDLLDIDENPVSENILRSALGDISRDGYCNMFSLDEDTLVLGGENILKSEGDLGQLLFAAAAGVTGLSKTLEGVHQEAETYYKPSGRKHELAKLKNELAGFEAKIRELDVQAHQYEKLFNDEQQARKSYAAARKDKLANTKRAEELKGLIDALVPWRTYCKTKDSLDELVDAQPLRDGWLEAAETQRLKDVEVRSGLVRLKKEIETVEAQVAQISVDDNILNQGEAIDRLQADDLEARYKTANDISNRERERETLRDQLERRLQELGRSGEEDPSALLLPAANVAQLRELISRHSGIEAKRDGAAEEFERAKEAVEKAIVAHDAYSDLVDLTRFSKRIEGLRSAADEDRLAALKHARIAAGEECDDAISLLTPWQGSPQDLAKGKPSPATNVSALIACKKKIDEAIRDADRDSEQLEDEAASLRADGDLNDEAVANFDDDTANRAHSLRDEKWIDHKKSFASSGPIDASKLTSSADEFEAAMEEDDRIRELRLRASTELAAYRESKSAQGRNMAAKQRLQEKREKTTAEGVTLQSEIDGVLSDLGLPSGMPIEDLPQWMDRRDEALRRNKAQKKANEEYEAAETAFEATKTTLTEELSKLEIEHGGCSVSELLGLCDEAITEWRRQATDKKSAEESLAAADEALVDRQQRFDAAEADRNDWLAEWSKILNASWMGSVDPELSTTAVTENLRVLDDIASALREIRELEDRVEAMKEDRGAYREEVQRLVAATRIDSQDADPLQTADMLRRELAQARRNKERVEEKRKQAADKLKELGELEADKA